MENWREVLRELIDSAQDDPILAEVIENRYVPLTDDEKLQILIGLIARVSRYQEMLEEEVHLR